jgi:hypothetical protein
VPPGDVTPEDKASESVWQKAMPPEREVRMTAMMCFEDFDNMTFDKSVHDGLFI